MQKVLYLRAELLPATETFVAAQASALQQFQPGFAGLRTVSDDFSKLGVIALAAPSSRALRRLYLWGGRSPHFESQLRAWAPDLLHAHFAVDACTFLPLARRLRKPLVVTLHGYDIGLGDSTHRTTAAGRVYLHRREQLWHEATALLCVSQQLRSAALERGYPSHKLLVHYTGVGVHTPPDHAPSGDRILFVGRLIEKKGCRYLVEAMNRVQAQHPRARLTVIGEGELRPELEAQARWLLPPCEFLGCQDPAIVRRFVERSRMVIVPSVRAENGDCEGLPTVILEAMERGRPVIAFSGCGADEAIVHGVTGYLIPPGDVERLAEAMLCLLQHSTRARDMGAAARIHVEHRFNLATQTVILERHYADWIRSYAH